MNNQDANAAAVEVVKEMIRAGRILDFSEPKDPKKIAEHHAIQIQEIHAKLYGYFQKIDRRV
jgi:hypothetical protein